MNIKGLLLNYLDKKRELDSLFLNKITKEIQTFMFRSDTITNVSFVISSELTEQGDIIHNILDFNTDGSPEEIEQEYAINAAIQEALPLFVELVGHSTLKFEINSFGPPIITNNYVFE